MTNTASKPYTTCNQKLPANMKIEFAINVTINDNTGTIINTTIQPGTELKNHLTNQVTAQTITGVTK